MDRRICAFVCPAFMAGLVGLLILTVRRLARLSEQVDALSRRLPLAP